MLFLSLLRNISMSVNVFIILQVFPNAYRKIKSYRDLHYKICKSRKNVNYYLIFWDVLQHDMVLDDEIAKWMFLENS